MRHSGHIALAVGILALGACSDGGKAPVAASASTAKNANVDDARLLAADKDGANWLSYGRTSDEQRFSPLTDVSDANVDKLGLAWSSDLDTARGQEATPIVVDGFMYVSTAWSMVKAYDAATGKPLWAYDPEVPREKLVDVCCDAVNRGVAVYKGKVFVATIAGHLVALDADTGKVIWDRMTIPVDSHMAITGAPRIVKGRVLIGAAGSEYITRGYLAAFDPDTGKEAWRFYTVPGDPAKPFEGKHLETAAKSWSGEWWKLGGGGTVWDSITYDPETDLVYFGTANAEPWNPAFRNTKEGDNLYTASIVAIHPDTGEYAWHYQETPEDRWDFDSDQQIIAATIPVNGRPQRVVMHAPKNGFFYVLDAKTGKFLSGKPFVTVNWANGLDPVTGRPDVRPEARYDVTGKPFLSLPSATGGHTWNPMSYSPKTGLVYIPANESAFLYAGAAKDWKPTKIGFQLGIDLTATAASIDPKSAATAAKANTGSLIAWDPVAQKARWTVKHPGPWNGGTLATAGNLVFQGTAGGDFRAYAADTGKQLWSFPTQTGVIAAPISYSVNGVQYVAILAGWGGSWDLTSGDVSRQTGLVRNISRMLVFKAGGTATLPAPPPMSKAVLDPPPLTGTALQVSDGAALYSNKCIFCHGVAAVAGALVPDLRHSVALDKPKLWQEIVHDGLLKERGMVGWAAEFTPTQIENIRHYVISRANDDKRFETKAKAEVKAAG